MESQDAVMQAIQAVRRGEYERARKLIAAALDADPSNVEAWLVMAKISRTRQGSIDCLEHALRLAPDHQLAARMLAELKNKPIETASSKGEKASKSGSRKSVFNHKAIWLWGGVVLWAVVIVAAAQGFLRPGTAAAIPTITPIVTPTTLAFLQPLPLASTPTLIPPMSTATLPMPTVYSTRTPTPDFPPAALVQKITGHKMEISLDCEANAASTWAGYYGTKIDEVGFFINLPTSDNPYFGFVGDVHGDWGSLPPDSYGVYAGPVADLLNKYHVPAKAVYSYSFDELRRQIAAANPVIVWVTGHVHAGTVEKYTTPEGVIVTVARYEHTVLVYGYDEDQVFILDGEDMYPRSIQEFLDSWSVLGNMAIIKSP
ncbi:MAG TPA: C39 family peptidase [Longilinea sp.]|nr:C39 family peptidase [Longilinea sp.]